MLVQGILWLGRALRRIALEIFRFFHWLVVPKGATPFDALKHYLSVIAFFIAVVALLWAGKQLVYPPVVITIADMPKPLRDEHWFNLEISRALIDQIERMRTIVKSERDTTFEAVLNPPNIVVKASDVSFNVREQLLEPLGSVLGRSPGEVYIAVTCFHPGCLRTLDSECREVAPAPKDGAPRTPAAAEANRYLCLRVTADIQRGKLRKRVDTRLVVSNDSYVAATTKEMGRIAEAVTTLADPATAALYFYLRAKQADMGSRAIRADGSDAAELRGQAFEAAGQAEQQDTVSACWAHSIRARIAIDRREYRLAESYIARAEDIPWWKHATQRTWPTDCRRLIAATKIALARKLALASSQLRSYPDYADDDDNIRRSASFGAIFKVVDELGGGTKPPLTTRIENWLLGDDLTQAALFAKAEIGLKLLDRPDQCRLVTEQPVTSSSVDHQQLQAQHAVRHSVRTIKALEASKSLGLLARQAALDFSESILRDKECLIGTRVLAEKLYLSHPNDAGMAAHIADLVIFAASRETGKGASDKAEFRSQLARVRPIYERMTDIGSNRADIFALGQLAIINLAFRSSFLVAKDRIEDRDVQILSDLTRAWYRFRDEHYSIEVRHRGEGILALWGALLLTSYSPSFAAIDVTKNPADPKFKDAAERMTQYLRATQAIFPGAQAKKLEDLPKLTGIGPRIGCVCMLTHIAKPDDNAIKIFLSSADRWWRNSVAFRTSCRRDLENLAGLRQNGNSTDEDERLQTDKSVAFERAKRLCHVAN